MVAGTELVLFELPLGRSDSTPRVYHTPVGEPPKCYIKNHITSIGFFHKIIKELKTSPNTRAWENHEQQETPSLPNFMMICCEDYLILEIENNM